MGKKNGKAPAFPLYASDFLTDTASWDVDEVGAYFRLLCNQWVNIYLPSDPDELQRICVVINSEKWAKIWHRIREKFVETKPGFLQNMRMEEERKIKKKFLSSQAEKAKKGAEARWGKGKIKNAPGDAQAIPEESPVASPEDALSSSSSSSGKKKNSKKKKRELSGRRPKDEQEVLAYFREMKVVNAEYWAKRFFNSYEAKDWMIGKTPIKDWKRCIHSWDSIKFAGQVKAKEEVKLPAQQGGFNLA